MIAGGDHSDSINSARKLARALHGELLAKHAVGNITTTHATHSQQGGGELTATASTPTGPWTRTYQNLAGRTLKTTFVQGTTEISLQAHRYDTLGRPISTTDADGVTQLLAYNAEGQAYRRAIDLNQNGQIDNADRTTETLLDVVATSPIGNAVRSRSILYDLSNNPITFPPATNPQTALPLAKNPSASQLPPPPSAPVTPPAPAALGPIPPPPQTAPRPPSPIRTGRPPANPASTQQTTSSSPPPPATTPSAAPSPRHIPAPASSPQTTPPAAKSPPSMITAASPPLPTTPWAAAPPPPFQTPP